GNWPGKVYTEEDWNPFQITVDEQALSHPIMAYVAGKLGAERAAWDFVKENKPHFTVTTLCPPNVFGPPEQELTSLKNLNKNNTNIYDVFNGTSEPRFTTWAWVDVRDLAQAHVLAIEAPAAANQRYLVTAGNYSAQAIADFIWKHYSERATAKGVKRGNPGNLYPDTGVFKVDNSKSIRDLGLAYKYGFDAMLRDTLTKLEELEAEGK
ncbi:methylglyoxal reductase (NADPH-dependent) gre2, partial [Tulasnella sp. 417]